MVLFGYVLCILIIGSRAAVNNGFKSYPTTVKTFENDTVLLPCYVEDLDPPTVHSVPENGKLEVHLGEEVDMACVAKGVPLPIISWKNKDGEIPFLYDRSHLRFHAENPNNAGRYTCVANNDVGEPATATIELYIRYKPRIEMAKTWMHAPPGIRVQLNCGVAAWPEATVEWFFNNRSVKYSSRIVKHNSAGDHSLVIRNVRTTDYGFYLCRASNSLGITEAAVELSGIANPAVFKRTSHSLAKTSYNFIWEVYSYSPIDQYEFRFRKYKNGVPGQWHTLHIPNGSDGNSYVHTYSFTLTGLEEASHYEAVVLSKNRYGWSKPSEIIRFATEGALSADEDNYVTNAIQEDKIIPAVQLASMSQHSTLSADRSGSSLNRAEIMIMILLYIFSVNF
ncbi:limbic system-associated membrane protein isoform X4 [Lasioglossum baleicum]|uniref:limbic system-associated membrane protein isoform X4 n=1 Tax=Lasioglossum baleicum TaxID=434251 RepID=UPI003FCE7BDC